MGQSAARQQRQREFQRSRARGREIDKQLTTEQIIESLIQVNHILLFDPHRCALALLRSLLTLYSYKEIAMISDLQTICHKADAKKLSPGGVEAKDRFLGELETQWDVVRKLWREPEIQRVWEELRVPLQTKDDNGKTKYVLQLSLPTSLNKMILWSDEEKEEKAAAGFVEHDYKIDGNLFRIYELGGQGKTEKKKWLPCFSNVGALLFVVSLASYNEADEEDHNELHKAIELFDEICNSRFFRRTRMLSNGSMINNSVILFLTHRDKFREKLAEKNIPLDRCFPEYLGPNAYDNAIEFIRQQFEQRTGPERMCYVYVTAEGDADVMKNLFNAMKDIVIRESLEGAGLM